MQNILHNSNIMISKILTIKVRCLTLSIFVDIEKIKHLYMIHSKIPCWFGGHFPEKILTDLGLITKNRIDTHFISKTIYF